MAVFYPSCTVDLTIRFDEAFNVDEDKDIRSVSQNTTDAQRLEGPATVRPLVTSEQKTARTSGQEGPALENGTFSPGGGAGTPLTIIPSRIPISCSVDLAGPRIAGSFNLTIAYRDLPIDPRIVKGASVEIYMGAVDPSDFGTGMVRVEADGSRKSILNTHKPNGERKEDLLLIVGIVDDWRVKHTSSGSTVEMTGRDLRGRLLDLQIDSRVFGKLDLTRPIDEVITSIISKHPEFPGLRAFTDKNDWPDGKIPSPASKDGSTRVMQKASGDGASSKPQGGDQVNFWDMVTQYCYLVGAIPYFVADKLVIRPAQNIYKQRGQDKEGATNTPFAGGKQRQLEGGDPFGVRRVVFGRDVEEYSFERKYTGKKRPVVEASGFNPGNGKRGAGMVIRAQYPDKKKEPGQSQSVGQDAGRPGDRTLGTDNRARNSSTTPGGQSHEETLRLPPIEGVTDVAKLRGIAQAVWEELGRGEIGGSVSTKNLSSFGTDPRDELSGNRDPDLLRLRPLDAVEILVDLRPQESQAPLTSSFVDSRRREFSDEVEEVTQRLGGNQAARDIARVIVAQSRGGILGLQTFFRVGTARFEFQRGGISISFDFQNYVEVNADTIPMRKGPDKPKSKSVPGSQGTSRV